MDVFHIFLSISLYLSHFPILLENLLLFFFFFQLFLEFLIALLFLLIFVTQICITPFFQDFFLFLLDFFLFISNILFFFFFWNFSWFFYGTVSLAVSSDLSRQLLYLYPNHYKILFNTVAIFGFLCLFFC